MGWNIWLTIGMIMLAIGVIAFIIGIVWYEINIRNRTSQNVWTYFFLIAGAVVGVIGCIMIAMGLIQSENASSTKMKYMEGPARWRTVGGTNYMVDANGNVLYKEAAQSSMDSSMTTGMTTGQMTAQGMTNMKLPPVVLPETKEEVYMSQPRIITPPETSMQFVHVKEPNTTIKLPPLVMEKPVVEDNPETWS